MPGVDAVIEAPLVIERRRPFELRPYADGFRLEGRIDGESGWFRHWPLEPSAGWIGATDENVVNEIGVFGCTHASVEWPSSAAQPDADLELAMPWPAACSTAMEERADTVRYELRCSNVEPERWVAAPAAAAFLGIGADGMLVRIVAEAARVRPSWEPILVRAGDYVATLQGERHLHVECLSWSGRDRGESLESAHGTAWLGRSADDSLTSITTGAVEGLSVDIPDAPRADEVSLWQRWPVAVRAAWWRDGGRARAQIRFGEEPPERWARLGGAEVWAGSSAAGELRAILLGDVEVPPAGFESTGHMGGVRGEEMLELARSIRFDLYGLARAVGVPDGFGSTYGIPSSLAITFGDQDAGDPWITVASTRDDHRIARWNALDRIGVDDVETASAAPWAVREISVDGTPARFDVFEVDERWVAVGRVAATTIWMAADRFPPTEVALERVDDLGPHVELRRARFAADGWRPHSPDGASLAAANVVHGLMEALDRNAGAPPIASAFTERVAAAWGGRDRYERLLGLHTMLRPVCGHGGGGPPVAHDDGSIVVRISIQHAVPSDGSGTVSTAFAVDAGENPEPGPAPVPAAIRRGERHEVELRLVQESGVWRIDTDLLQILVDRLGSLEEVVRPLSEQIG